MQFPTPSASPIPPRLPLKHTMFGTPAAAAAGIIRSASATSWSCWFGRLKPLGIVPNPLAMAHTSPCCLGTSQSFSSSRSIAAKPIPLAAMHNSSSVLRP